VPHVARELRVVRPWRRPLMFQFVCMGGTPERMKDFAYYIMEEIGHKLPTGTMLQDISQKSYRYSMYKVGPVLCISVSIHYCPQLMRTALNMTAWAGFLAHGLTYRSCLSRLSLSLHLSLSTGHHLLSVRFKTSLQSNLCTTVTRQSITENIYIYIYINSHAQDNCNSAQCIFKWNTSVTVNNHLTV